MAENCPTSTRPEQYRTLSLLHTSSTEAWKSYHKANAWTKLQEAPPNLNKKLRLVYNIPLGTVQPALTCRTVQQPLFEFMTSPNLHNQFQQVHNAENVSQTRCFFLDASGWNEKTCLISAIKHWVSVWGWSVITVAISVLAAKIIEGGRTFYCAFSISVHCSAEDTCYISVDSSKAEKLREHSLIIWYEIMMRHCHIYQCSWP